MSEFKKITVAYGDGIGPEIMESTLQILKEAKAKINIEVIEVGRIMYERGFSSGIPPEAWKTINENKILLKAPITTPQGGGYKSLNVTMRKRLGLFANIRPCVSYAPFIKTKHPILDIVIIRENEEDLYTGIEYRQSYNTYQSLKLITKEGSEKIIRFAFDYAVKNNRKKVTCFTKDNIMKFTDGLFRKIFDLVAKEYPQITSDHLIIDIGTAKLASKPENFDVIVTSNLYGDIISDVVAEISGSVGVAGSANIGSDFALFEAIHGSAPDIAGKNIANPSGLLNAAIMMLVHIGQTDIASKIHNALLKTIEDGMHTTDIYDENSSKKKLSTTEFTQEIIKRLGEKPNNFKTVSYQEGKATNYISNISTNQGTNRKLVGVDVAINCDKDVDQIADDINQICLNLNLGLQNISGKGLKIWPKEEILNNNYEEINLRFISKHEHKQANYDEILKLLEQIQSKSYNFLRVNNLFIYGEELGFSLIQGE